MDKSDLLGRWIISEWTQEFDDGRLTHPMGKDLRGFIEYAPQSLFVVIERADRNHFTSGGQWNSSDHEKALAYDTYLSYAGTWAIEGQDVIHHIDHSIFPNWEGAMQKRRAQIIDGALHLTARMEQGSAQARTIRLKWMRPS